METTPHVTDYKFYKPRKYKILGKLIPAEFPPAVLLLSSLNL